MIGVGSGLILAWLGWVIFSTETKERQRKIALPRHRLDTTPESYSAPRFAQKWRNLAKITLVIFVLSGIGIGYGYVRANQKAVQARKEKVIVLLARIDGPKPKEYGVTDQLIVKLDEQFGDSPNILLETVSEAITEDQGSPYARALGEEYQADLVIWGWYNATSSDALLTIHFENLTEQQVLPLESSESHQLQAAVAELDSFSLQQKLGDDLSRLVFFIRGMSYYEAGAYDQALADFELIVTTNDHLFLKEVIIYFYRGNVYNYLGQYERAIEDYDQALDINPQYAAAYNNRGVAYGELGEYERAIQDYDQALDIDPRDAKAYYNRGNAYRVLGQYEREIEDYDQALDINPQLAETYNNRGAAYRVLGQYERAIEDYDQALEINPQLAEAYNNRGNAYSDLSQYERAIQDYDQALDIDPRDAKAYYNRGNAYRVLGQYERAIQDYDQALEINPQLAEAYNNRGFAYRNLGQSERAERDFQKALQYCQREEVCQAAQENLDLLQEQ